MRGIVNQRIGETLRRQAIGQDLSPGDAPRPPHDLAQALLRWALTYKGGIHPPSGQGDK